MKHRQPLAKKTIMFQIVFIILTCYANVLYSLEKENNITNPFPPDKLIKKNIPRANGTQVPTNWNISDWKNHFNRNGMNTSTIGNTQSILGDSKEKELSSKGDPRQITNESIKENDNFKNKDYMKGWDNEIQQAVMSNSISNPFISSMQTSDAIKCFITRDISFKWRCRETGQIFGGDISKSGREARIKCKSECYEQKGCINLTPNKEDFIRVYKDVTCNFSKSSTCLKKFSLNKEYNIEKIQLIFGDSNITKNDKTYNISISLTKVDNSIIDIVKNLNRKFISDDNTTININNYRGKSFTLILRKVDNNIVALLKEFRIFYKAKNKYICPYLQDISRLNIDDFGYKCHGKLVTYNVNGRKYTICNDGKNNGDNPDGTFSNESTCLAYCKLAGECEPSQNTFTTEDLKTFREGCIEGQEGCDNSHNDCRNARLMGDIVLEETVFDATSKATQTIKDGVQAQGVYRPRVSMGEDLTFERRNQEEWKDDAFKDMAQNGKYTSVTFSIGEEGNISNAYRLGYLSGASYGVAGAATRALSWELKPKGFDVNNDIEYYLYAILVGEFGYHDYNINGELEKKKKVIWYIKTSKDDTFKPIKIAKDVGFPTLDENNNTSFSGVVFSELKDKTFTGSNWVSLSISQPAEYFDTIKFENNPSPYWSIPIIKNISNLIYELPGMVRSIKRVAAKNDIYNYDGNFDGTGDGLLNYSIYTLYSQTMLTYSELYDKIQNNVMKKIYKSGEEGLHLNKVKDDGNDDGTRGIEIYQYGKKDKTDLYLRIRPKKEDIGKKGFIYVFIQ